MDKGTTVLGIIGGSGLYQLAGLEDVREERVSSPFGEPSDAFVIGRLGDLKLVFLPRHGRGHRLPPAAINYRANIDALKRLGVTDILSLSACGSLREDYAPGDFVIVDQYIDRTIAREKSFFGVGCVAHVSLAEPVCGRLGGVIADALSTLDVTQHRGGTYLAMEGPQFSTKAESHFYRSLGADVIGMTNMPEAKLAREAEMCYASVAMVTDYDCWHAEHGAVEVDHIIAVLHRNAEQAKALVRAVADRLSSIRDSCSHGCDRALEMALITAPEARDPMLTAKLDAVAGRILQKR
ncbi:MAG: S-methyl-5'-thioadenosine phosphorylase [Sphingomonadales bacterium]|nr:S-methyl-5'-thioadenosine phosphorylase [Sphingomonadales bacterium]